ncbi:MAG: hypothetical protein AAF226_03760 [Verrucomicrobiota bacterium]
MPRSPSLWVKFIIGLLLLPLVWVTLETFFVLFQREAAAGALYRSPEFFWFGVGSAFWLLLFYVARNKVMMWLYVAGHELTHALFALLCRGKVSEIHISSSGGHIMTNKTNFLVSLSPYFFPFYSVIFIAVWALLEAFFFDFSDRDRFWLYGGIGLTWMFHISFTIWMTMRKQTDITMNGKVFSFSLIVLMNLLIMSALLIAASPHVTFGQYHGAWIRNLTSIGSRFMSVISDIAS